MKALHRNRRPRRRKAGRTPGPLCAHSIALVGRVAIVTVILAAGLAACGGDEGSDAPAGDGANAAATEKLRVISFPGTIFSLPVEVGEMERFFDDRGLDVTALSAESGPAATAALAAGSADMTINNIDNGLLARAEGIDAVAVAGALNASSFTLIGRKGLSTPNAEQGFPAALEDLRGKKIGVIARGSASENHLKVMLKEAGFNPEGDVTILPVGIATTALAALKQGRVDALMATEPVTSKAVDVERIAKVIVDLRDGSVDALDLDSNQWFTLAPILKAKPEAIERFRAAIKDSYAFMADPSNRQAMIDLVTDKIASGDQAFGEALVDNNLKYFAFDVRPETVTKASELLMTLGLVDDAETADAVLDLGE